MKSTLIFLIGVVVGSASQSSDIATLQLIGHTSYVCALAFSSDGTQLASGSFDGSMRVWDLAAQRQTHAFEHDDFVRSVEWDNGGLLKTTIDRGTRYTCMLKSGKKEQQVRDAQVQSLAPMSDSLPRTQSQNGYTLYGCEDKSIEVKDAQEQVVYRFPCPGRIRAIALSPDGNAIAFSAADYKKKEHRDASYCAIHVWKAPDIVSRLARAANTSLEDCTVQ